MDAPLAWPHKQASRTAKPQYWQSGHESENRRGGHEVRTPMSVQFRGSPLDRKFEKPHQMSVLKSSVIVSFEMSSRCHIRHEVETLGSACPTLSLRTTAQTGVCQQTPNRMPRWIPTQTSERSHVSFAANRSRRHRGTKRAVGLTTPASALVDLVAAATAMSPERPGAASRCALARYSH